MGTARAVRPVSEALDAVDLKEPKVVYHDRSGASVELVSRTGKFDRKNLTVTASGDVIMRYKDYVFRSPEVRYSHEKLQRKHQRRLLLRDLT